MTIVPWRNFVPDKTGEFVSPFIMVFKYAGIDWAAALVFFVVITAASSSLNSLLFSAGRHLYQVANGSRQGSVLRFFSLEQVSGHKVPARAILMSGLFILLSPAVSLFPAVTQAFTWFSSASSAVIIGIYILTVIAHWKYRSSSDFTADGFLMPAYKIFDALAIAFSSLSIFRFLWRQTQYGLRWADLYGLRSSVCGPISVCAACKSGIQPLCKASDFCGDLYLFYKNLCREPGRMLGCVSGFVRGWTP